MKQVYTRITRIDRKKIGEYRAQDNFSAALKFDKFLSEKEGKLVKFFNS
ncbi:hypothetical protein GCM10023260_04080 [Bartonella acomydis]|uniref:Uncharacterized protein n=1 Tax=Bartonella acomydis TaxID=686234 RepID=A0ABP9MII3_9HYPH